MAPHNGVRLKGQETVAEAGPAINPIEQFELSRILRVIVGHSDVSLTNSAIFMAIAAGLTPVSYTHLTLPTIYSV